MFGQILIPVTRKAERRKNDRVYIMFNARGSLIRGTYDIPEGTHPEIYVPIFEFQRIVRTLKLNVKPRMTPEQRRESQRASLQRYRQRKRDNVQLSDGEHGRVLSNAEVKDIRRLKNEQYTNVDIARMKGISPSLVSKIVNNHRRVSVVE